MTRLPRILPTLVLAALLPSVPGAAPFDCVIEPKALVNLVATDKGRIERIDVGRGERVSAGDPLIRLNDDVQRLLVKRTKAQMDSDVEIRAGEARVVQQRRELERARQLASRNVAAQTVVEEAEFQLALTELAVEQAAIARSLARIENEQAQVLLERRVIRSPVDGVVVSVAASAGEFATEQLEILTVAEVDPLHVEVFVPASYWGRISPGAEFEVSERAPLTGVHMATVSVIDQVFDAASGTFGVRLALPNPDGTIPAGTRCYVDFDSAPETAESPG